MQLSLISAEIAGVNYAEIDILCMILLLMLLFKTNTSSFGIIQKKSFGIVLICHLIFTISDLIWIFNNGYYSLQEIFSGYGIPISFIFNAVNVIIPGFTGFAWLVFAEVIQSHSFLHCKIRMTVFSIPIWILVILTAITQRTHFMFYVSEQGEFTRGPGYAIQVLISIGYVLIATIVAARRALHAKSAQERQASRAIAGFIILPICTIILQLLFPRIQVMFLGSVTALVNVYISLQQTQVLTDPLTGLNNRMLLDLKFETAIQSWSKNYNIYLMLIDADKFKNINDKYGHIVGDQVLKLIADALRKNCDKADFICRFGGDEFIILHRAPYDEDCTPVIEGIDRMLASTDFPFPVSVSIGVCRYTKSETLDACVKVADKDMYRIKSEKRNNIHI